MAEFSFISQTNAEIILETFFGESFKFRCIAVKCDEKSKCRRNVKGQILFHSSCVCHMKLKTKHLKPIVVVKGFFSFFLVLTQIYLY